MSEQPARTKSNAIKVSSKGLKFKYGLLLVVAAIGAIIFGIYIASSLSKTSLGRVVVDDTYANWAWGFTYGGDLITDTGYVCEVNLDQEQVGEFEEARDAGLPALSDYLLRHSNCQHVIPENDAGRLSELAGKINERNLVNDGAGIHTVDAGSSCITVWNYEANESYDIECSGDTVGENPSYEAQEIIYLTDKYLGNND